MRETGFIKQNKEKWIEFEKHLLQGKKDPDKLSSQFIQVTDDLSYSRTFYPNRSVRVYLNNVAQKVFHSIYKARSKRWSRFKEFWKDELPQIVYDSRKQLLLSFVVFTISIGIGVLSSIFNPEFPRQILGDAYIEMTNANIEKGDPMAVYKEWSEMDMLLGITLNNLLVAALTFVMGIFFSVGTIGIMIVNGIMIGCFQYFFYERGLFLDSFLTIWLHGTLEISAIVIAGGAGLTLGNGIVFPGTYTRGQAFRIAAQRGMKIMMGIMPIICFAAIIESFITRYTGVPAIVKALLIAISALFIITYFVIIPYLKAKQGFKKLIVEAKLPPSPDDHIRTDVVKDSGEVFKDSFVIIRRISGKMLPWIVLLFTCYAVAYSFLFASDTTYRFSLHVMYWGLVENAFDYFADVSHYFDYTKRILLAPANPLTFSLIAMVFFYHFKKEMGQKDLKFTWNYFFGNFWKPFIVGAVISSLFFLPLNGACWLAVLFMPIFLVWLVIMHGEKMNVFASLGRAFNYCFGSFGRVYGIYMILLLVSILSMSVISAPQIVWFVFEVLYWFIDIEGEVYWNFFVAFFTLVSFIALGMILILFLAAYAVQFHTLREIREANALRKRVETIGLPKPKRSVIYSLILLISLGTSAPAIALRAQQSEEEIELLIDSLQEAAQVLTDSTYYSEYYQDSSWYDEQDKKLQNYREYYRSDQGKNTMREEDWKKAVQGIDYTEWEEEQIKQEVNKENKSSSESGGGGLFSAGFAQVFLFALAALLIGVVLMLLIRNNILKGNKNIKKKRVFSVEEAEENIHESDLERLLREYLLKGDFRSCIRVYYLMVLRELSEKEWIRWKKDKTNREYLVEMRTRPVHKGFLELTRAFEYAWYGDAEVPEKDFKLIQPHFAGMIEVVKNSEET